MPSPMGSVALAFLAVGGSPVVEPVYNSQRRGSAMSTGITPYATRRWKRAMVRWGMRR